MLTGDPVAEQRAKRMGLRVTTAARRLGVETAGLDLLTRAHRLAMTPRFVHLEDDHHADFLHPGRSVLVLLMDVEERRPPVLAAGMMLESEREQLRVDHEVVGATLGPSVEAIVRAAPLPKSDQLAERLVTAPEEVRLVTLAERLDHLRHLHLSQEQDRWAEVHDLTFRVYRPVADRTHATLAGRYSWWCGMFERQFLTNREMPDSESAQR